MNALDESMACCHSDSDGSLEDPSSTVLVPLINPPVTGPSLMTAQRGFKAVAPGMFFAPCFSFVTFFVYSAISFLGSITIPNPAFLDAVGGSFWRREATIATDRSRVRAPIWRLRNNSINSKGRRESDGSTTKITVRFSTPAGSSGPMRSRIDSSNGPNAASISRARLCSATSSVSTVSSGEAAHLIVVGLPPACTIEGVLGRISLDSCMSAFVLASAPLACAWRMLSAMLRSALNFSVLHLV
mmetsp:Transcript_14041/g.33482  ORF Transcript_14041/g.33482 Transcript_14041/m.33482 type:complete len:243 (+) Transcript_14041:153-881(+)